MIDKEELNDFDNKVDKARELLQSRQQAYHQVFGEDKSVHAEAVLGDPARFCRANESTFHADPRIHAALEGRREVWLRIQEHLKLSQYELEQKALQKWGVNGSTRNSNTNKHGTNDKYTSGTAEQFTDSNDNSGLDLKS